MNAIKRVGKEPLWIVFAIILIGVAAVFGRTIFDWRYPTEETKSPISVKWTQLSSPPGGGIWSITISPSNPEIIYAATRDLNILKSSNGGESWVQKGERRLGAHIFSTIAVDPNDPNRVYASNGMLHISVNGGDTWEATEIGTGEDLGIVGVSVSFSDPKIIYAHDNNGEVHKSIDKGLTWNTVNKIEDFPLSNKVLVDPTNSDVIYIVTNNNENGISKIFKSEAGGKTFETITETENIRSLVMDQKNPAKLYFASSEGIYRTSNYGGSWEKVRTDDALALAISRSNPEVLIYGNEQGEIYKSVDGGDVWLLTSSVDIHDWGNFDIAINPTNPDIVYVGTDEGFLKSTGGGMAWKVINNGVVDDGTFALAVDPKDSNKLYVGNYWTRGVFVTGDGGSTWNLLEEWRHSDVPDHYPMEIGIDPRNSSVVYIAGEYGLKKTTDGGKTWVSLGGDLFYGKHVHGLDMDPLKPDILYLGSGKSENSLEGGHIFKTADGGKTWEEMANGFPMDEEANVWVISIADSNPNVVYAGTNAHSCIAQNPKPTKELGVYKTMDGGKSWKAVNNGLSNKNIYALAVDPQNPNIIYAGVGHGHQEEESHKGLYRSADGGESWKYIEDLPWAEVSHIRFHPKNSAIILVSFGEVAPDHKPEGKGIYATIDSGENWYFVSDGFTERQQIVMDVVFDSRGDIIYAGTDDGLFKGEIEIKR